MKQTGGKVRSVQRFGIADFTVGQLNAIVKKLGGPDEAKRLLQDDVTVTIADKVFTHWNGGIFTCDVTSRGYSGEGWSHKLLETDAIDPSTVEVLRSPKFKPNGGRVYRLMLFPVTYFKPEHVSTLKIRKEATLRGFKVPPPEVACLLRERCTLEALNRFGVDRIVVMHTPIDTRSQGPSCLVVRTKMFADGEKVALTAHPADTDYSLERKTAFAFLDATEPE